MKRAGRAAIAALSVIMIIVSVMPGAFLLRAEAVSAADTEKAINDILDNEMSLAGAGSVQALLDGKYAENAGSGTDWFVLSIIQYKGTAYNYDRYAAALKDYCAKKNSYDTPVTKERFALMFMLLNTNDSYIRETAENCIGSLGLMSLIFGLHMIENGSSSSKTESEVINDILSAQLNDGGWDIQNKASDPDVTAMAVQALAPCYGKNSSVKQAVDKALSRLSSMQLANGGYKSYGTENPESCAQVITALTSLGINPFKDERFIKNGKTAADAMLGYKLSSGGFAHKSGGDYNATATSQALYSLVSVYRLQNGMGSLYNLKTGIKTETPVSKTAAPTSSKVSTTSASGRESGTAKIIKSSVKTTSPAKTTQAASSAADSSVTQTAAHTDSGAVTFTSASASRTRRGSETSKPESSKAQKEDKKTEKSTTAPARETSRAVNKERETTAPAAGLTSVSAETVTVYEEPETVIEEKTENTPDDETEEFSSYDSFTENEKAPKEEKENENTEETESSERHLSKPKKYIIAAIWGSALIIALVFIIKKNKKAVNYAIIFGVAAALTAGTVLADIQSPESYYRAEETSSSDTVTVTMSITCDTVKGRGEESITPSSGVILPETEFTLDRGATAYDCLIKAAKEYKIQIEDNTQALGNHSNAYIAGINYLYEFDYGELSGWMYSVNGEFADRGCGEYTLSDSDIIRWEYTCNMGDDLK